MYKNFFMRGDYITYSAGQHVARLDIVAVHELPGVHAPAPFELDLANEQGSVSRRDYEPFVSNAVNDRSRLFVVRGERRRSGDHFEDLTVIICKGARPGETPADPVEYPIC